MTRLLNFAGQQHDTSAASVLSRSLSYMRDVSVLFVAAALQRRAAKRGLPALLPSHTLSSHINWTPHHEAVSAKYGHTASQPVIYQGQPPTAQSHAERPEYNPALTHPTLLKSQACVHALPLPLLHVQRYNNAHAENWMCLLILCVVDNRLLSCSQISPHYLCWQSNKSSSLVLNYILKQFFWSSCGKFRQKDIIYWCF